MENIEEIKEKFKEVISFSQGIVNPKVDKLFKKWQSAKSRFIEKMGNELIYEFPEKITFTLGTKDRERRVEEFTTTIVSRYGNTPLSDFIFAMKDGFFDNTVSFNYTYKDKVITKGTKLIKAFKHFEEDKSVLTDIQNHASRIIQEDKIEGTLCLSVHPLDFLSLSENTHNWRSCHALDGEYRSGNLSYMVDSSTVICYLKSDNDEMLPRFPFKWNSKKWRVLLFFSCDNAMLMAGRQYPFFSETSLDCIVNKLLPASGLIGKNLDIKWHHDYLESMNFSTGETVSLQPYIPVGSILRLPNELIIDNSRLHYNDLLYSSCYTPYYAYIPRVDWEWSQFYPTGHSNISTYFYIGGEVPCLYCEEKNIENNEVMACEDCAEDFIEPDIVYCDICGTTMSSEESFRTEELTLCPHCFDSKTEQCERCGQIVLSTDLIYNREKKISICFSCQMDLLNEEELEEEEED